MCTSSRNPAHLTAALAHAKAHNYSLGVKICRGAYHGKESSRWTDKLGLATPTPVWALKPETDACYDSGIDVLLDAVTRDIKTKVEVPRVAVIFATHNPESVEKVVKGMRKRRLARPSKDVGGEQEELLEVGKEARKRIAIGQLYGEFGSRCPFPSSLLLVSTRLSKLTLLPLFSRSIPSFAFPSLQACATPSLMLPRPSSRPTGRPWCSSTFLTVLSRT